MTMMFVRPACDIHSGSMNDISIGLAFFSLFCFWSDSNASLIFSRLNYFPSSALLLLRCFFVENEEDFRLFEDRKKKLSRISFAYSRWICCVARCEE